MNISLQETPATITILAITIGLSLLAMYVKPIWGYLALVPFRMVARNEYHALITSGLIHANLAHLGLNMMTLYFFGPSLERLTGSGAFLGIYLISLVAGNLYPFFKYRHKPDYVAIGASGAVSGIVFAFCLAEPMASLYLYFIIKLPAFVVAFLYVGYSIYAMRKVQDNIGHEAHLAGAVGGILATLLLTPGIAFFMR